MGLTNRFNADPLRENFCVTNALGTNSEQEASPLHCRALVPDARSTYSRTSADTQW